MPWFGIVVGVHGSEEQAFATGTFRELGGSNPSVLAYLREGGDEVMLCVNNLSRTKGA